MISIRKFLTAKDAPESEELLHVVQLLLQGIALHAVEGDRHDHEKFRSDMQKLLDGLEGAQAVAALLVITGSALKTLEDYNQRTTRYIRMQGAELQNMIGMLTRTIATLGTGTGRSVAKLREIEGQLEKASVIEEVRMIKLRMEQCLESIREEAQRQKVEASHTAEGLKHEIRESQERMHSVTAAPVRDPVTGLPTRADLEAVLGEVVGGPSLFYAALFVVDRVGVINSRFGYAMGDRVLKIYVDELSARLSAADKLYRWNGPALVALLERPDPIEKVRGQLVSLVPPKLERTIQLATRTALLPISATWAVFPVVAPLDDLIHQLDAFIATQWQEREA
jgi:GGDEF domain-containing protein